MALNIKTISFSLSTATAGNTQDITISGFGTPSAAIFIHTSAVTSGTITAVERLGIGFTDGTNDRAVEIASSDAVGTSVTGRTMRNDRVIELMNPSTNTELAGFGFNSWITDGVRLDIDIATTTANIVTCILIGGSDVSGVYVGHKDDLGTGTGAVAISGVGFEPDVVLMTCTGDSTALSNNSAQGILSFGVGVNDGIDTQRQIGYSAVDNVISAKNTSYISNNSICGQFFNDALNWKGVIGGYGLDGFTITPSASASSDIISFICLKFTGSPDISLFDMTWPTSGNYAETTPGFTPAFGLISSCVGPAARDTLTTASNYSVAITAFDGTNIYTVNGSNKDLASTMVAKSLHAAKLKFLDEDGVTTAVEASSYTFDSQGWDFILSTNPASAVLGFGLAIGQVASGGGFVPAWAIQRNGIIGAGI